MDIQLRLLNAADVIQYRQLKLLSFKESPFAFSESYEDELLRDTKDFEQEIIIEGAPPESFVLGAFQKEDNLIGMARFARDKRSKARHKSMIKTMYVHPEFRSKKIGHALLKALLERVDKIGGLEQIHLWVLHSKTNASNFYAKFGFERQGILVKGDVKIENEYVDAEYMVKYLHKP